MVGDDKLSSVQYMAFAVGGRVPVAVGSGWEGYGVRAQLSEAQRAALVADLSS